MSANRTQWFYSGILTTAATYILANSFEFNGALNTLRIVNTGSFSLKFSIKGADDSIDDGEILAGEDKEFREFQGNRVAVKNGSGSTTVRVWAY